MAACAMRMRPSSHGPPPRPPRTGIDTARPPASPASGPECRKSSSAAPAASRAFACSTNSSRRFPPWNSANTAIPASASDFTTEAGASTLTICAPPSSTRRRAFCAFAKRGGRSQERSARFTPRRTALHTTSISSSVISPSFSPQRLTPTESPTETRSTPARSAICAIWKSQATTPAILRPSRFIFRRVMTLTLATMLVRGGTRHAADRGDHRAGVGASLARDVERAAVRNRREQHRRAYGERRGPGRGVGLGHDVPLVVDHHDKRVVVLPQEHGVGAERPLGGDAAPLRVGDRRPDDGLLL